MSYDTFYWIGVCATALAVLLVVGAVLFVAYATLLHGRFNLILFREGERRLSIASWHNARFARDDFEADDWPIGKRPFYLSYKLNDNRRLFIMCGTISGPRFGRVRGAHPEKMND
jgi:hypothetical protein